MTKVRGVTRRAFVAGSIGATVASTVYGKPVTPTVDCRAGRFIGMRLNSGVGQFLGIRYGWASRFMAPIREVIHNEPVRATAFGPAAPQLGKRQPQSEDCLFLNVWTPIANEDARLPVVVYFHGGAYAFGSGTDPVSDGAKLAERSVVVVTVNHRLNVFGYLYLARLNGHFPDSGNAGQLDLALALNWVNENIASFGGDPQRIMAFGDSGGGGKVSTLLAMPTTAGLIHRAVTMSGQQVTVSGPLNATQRTRAYLSHLGVSEQNLWPLLSMPVDHLLEGLNAIDPVLGGAIYFGPVLDQKTLLRHPFWPDAHPGSLLVPMMTGNAHDEMRAFVDPDAAFVRDMSWHNVAGRIGAELPVDILPEWIVAEYRRRLPDASPADIYFMATTAGRSWRGQLEVAEARARAGKPVWLYQVDFTSRADPRRGAFHSIDVPLVFGTFDAPGAGTGNDFTVRQMSNTLQDYFVAFAKSGIPYITGKSAWPQYEFERRSTMIFDVATRVEDDPRAWQRQLFANAPYSQPGS
ncbi:MAG: carboxylesterase [Alphaproteobacteria bacterium HGW-Alphaproteobacteria-7]|jgi:para-nitrobenzyl esterase|nr:MAG: carboxylesterase [Alphaproteobacteria bacterium HGW-Alphaproteobacteria-7]